MSLTKYQEGSLKELLHVSFPLMLSSLSVLMMIFVDRVFMLNYSVQAFNAVVNASTLGWSFIVGWLVLGSISEVFVAQYNGSGKQHKLGEPVWQMLWAALFSIILFVPLGLYGGSYLFNAGYDMQMQLDYFRWMMIFGFSFPMYGALCGFFIGQGKVVVVTTLAVLANFVNGILDYILIYGIEGWVPSFGVNGAAVATCSSQLFQAIVLFGLFLSSNNRRSYNTDDYLFKWGPFKDCLRIGVPSAACVFTEILAWAVYYQMMTEASPLHITVAGISQSLIVVLYFFSEGLSKGVIAIVGNLIGGKKFGIIPKVISTAALLNGLFFIAIFIPLTFFTEQVFELFLIGKAEVEILQYGNALPLCLAMVSFYMLFEGFRMIYAGVLTAAGDTKFLMITGATMIWIFVILPVKILIIDGKGSIELSQLITTIYAAIIFATVYWRYLRGNWQKITITQTEGN